jgi:hypothetical protein
LHGSEHPFIHFGGGSAHRLFLFWGQVLAQQPIKQDLSAGIIVCPFGPESWTVPLVTA